MPKIQVHRPVEIKIATVVAVAIILRETNLSTLDAAMQEMTGGENDYFDNEFAVIDVGFLDLAEQAIDWTALIALFKTYHLNPVAVRNATPEMQSGIFEHGLSLESSVKPRQQQTVEQVEQVEATDETSSETMQETSQEAAPVAVVPVVAEPTPAPVAAAPASLPAKPGSMIVDTPVRAGQRIYARGCDLVIMATVNNGAEVIADGSIHIYAPLRGRALAGASGDTSARIFVMSMEAELISIAGMYRTFEEGLPKNLEQQPVQVSLDGDRLDLRAISAVTRH